MRYIFTMALRNLTRHRLRTFVSIIAIAISVMVVVFTRGLITGFFDSTFSLYVQYNTGHIRIVDREYQQKERLLSLNHPVDGFNGQQLEGMLGELETIEGVELAVPRLKFGAAASPGDELVKMMGWGVDPQKELAFTDIEDKLTAGRMASPGKREVVMGSGLLEKMDKQVGDRVTILYNTSFSSFKGTTLEIVGEIGSGLSLLRDRVFYLPLDQAQEILMMDGMATEILLQIPDMERVGEVTPRVEQLFEEKGVAERYALLPWNREGSLLSYFKVAFRIYDVVYIFLILLAAVIVINTMVMIIKERTREIGMMSAMGMEDGQILRLFVLEGGIMGLLGSLLGATAGGIITRILARVGINYTELVEGMGEEILMSPIIYPVFSLENMVYGFILGTIITTLACIIPARRAARLDPTQALREI